MGFRVRKSIKLGKGVKLNIGKKSVGISAGGKHGGISVNSRTGAQARVSAPGTGLSYTTKLSGSKKTRASSSSAPKRGTTASPAQKGNAKTTRPPKPPKSPKVYLPSGIALSIIGLLLLFLFWPLGLLSIAIGIYYITCGPKIYADAVAKYKAVHPEYKEGQ